MSESRKGKGRGRRSTVEPSPAAPGSASKQPKPDPDEAASVYDDPNEDVTMRDADDDGEETVASSSKSPSTRRLAPTRTGSSSTEKTSRAVGGLLGQSEYSQTQSRASTPSLARRFVPKQKKPRSRAPSDDEEDVKKEDQELRPRGRGRGRGAFAPRKELEMTASGPMAQGPGGAPKGYGSKATSGPAGSGVMNASRNGTQLSTGRFRDAEAEDGSDDGESDEDDNMPNPGMKIMARELDSIGREDSMAPLTLPRDPNVERLAEERRKERALRKAKAEAQASAIKPEPGEMESRASSIMLSSATATPGLETDSKADTLDSKSVMINEDFKEIKPEQINLGPAFNLEPEANEQIYMFQFPRKFPKFVDPDEPEVKEEKEVKPKFPFEWGRTASRKEKGARWAKTQGQIGELLVHKSGKVSLVINNDLTYEILPAAQPSFLQEIAVLDDKELNKGSSDDSDDEPRQKKPNIVMIGQTSKKFLVVPEVNYLLEKVAEQEAKEKEEEKRLKAVKKERTRD